MCNGCGCGVRRNTLERQPLFPTARLSSRRIVGGIANSSGTEVRRNVRLERVCSVWTARKLSTTRRGGPYILPHGLNGPGGAAALDRRAGPTVPQSVAWRIWARAPRHHGRVLQTGGARQLSLPEPAAVEPPGREGLCRTAPRVVGGGHPQGTVLAGRLGRRDAGAAASTLPSHSGHCSHTHTASPLTLQEGRHKKSLRSPLRKAAGPAGGARG